MDRDSAPWWAAVRRHELLLQQCGGCGAKRFPPRTICNRCRSREAAWVPALGTGTVASWIVNHQPFTEDLPVPYVVLHVRLDDGDDIHMYGNLIDAEMVGGGGVARQYEIEPGMPVRAVFVDSGDTTLVQWSRLGH